MLPQLLRFLAQKNVAHDSLPAARPSSPPAADRRGRVFHALGQMGRVISRHALRPFSPTHAAQEMSHAGVGADGGLRPTTPAARPGHTLASFVQGPSLVTGSRWRQSVAPSDGVSSASHAAPRPPGTRDFSSRCPQQNRSQQQQPFTATTSAARCDAAPQVDLDGVDHEHDITSPSSPMGLDFAGDLPHMDIPEAGQGRAALPEAWDQLRAVNIEEEVAVAVTTLRKIPPCVRASYRRIQAQVLAAIRQAYAEGQDGEPADLERLSLAWKLFLLFPRMLLCPVPAKADRDSSYRDVLHQRVRDFDAGEWGALLTNAQRLGHPRARRQGATSEEDAHALRLAQAAQLIEQGEFSHAARTLKPGSVAPSTPATLAELRNPELRPPQLTQPLPPAAS